MVSESYKADMKSRTRKELEQVLSCYRGQDRVGKLPPSARQKMEWVERYLRGDLELTNKEEETITEYQDRPYQVVLAEKYAQLYKSATRRGKDFNLTIKDVHLLLQEKECYYTGTPFEPNGNYSRTVDRVDNAKGYVKGNVVACTFIANQMKEELFERPTNNTELNIQFIAKVAEVVLSHTKRD